MVTTLNQSQRAAPVRRCVSFDVRQKMKIALVCLILCVTLVLVARGGDEPADLVEEAAQIVIGPTFGRAFDPTTEAVARIRDRKLIEQILNSAIGKQPEEVDHHLMLPHLQVAVLNTKGEIIAAYALDRTPAKNSLNSRAVLRTAQVVRAEGKTTIDLKDMFQGFPCKALETYRFQDQELPKTNGEQGVTPQSATRPESDSEGNDKPQPESESRPR